MRDKALTQMTSAFGLTFTRVEADCNYRGFASILDAYTAFVATNLYDLNFRTAICQTGGSVNMSNAQENDKDTNLDPGDEAPPGTPGAGEDLCPTCDGSGRINGAKCETCGGTGRITEEVGGG